MHHRKIHLNKSARLSLKTHPHFLAPAPCAPGSIEIVDRHLGPARRRTERAAWRRRKYAQSTTSDNQPTAGGLGDGAVLFLRCWPQYLGRTPSRGRGSAHVTM